MITQVELSIRTATKADEQKLAKLLTFEANVHRHLDFKSPLGWIGSDPFFVLEKNKRIIAALACPPDPACVAWIRLFASDTSIDERHAWAQLWPEVYAWLKNQPDVEFIAAIPLSGWFRQLLEDTGFAQSHHIVMMAWQARNGPIPSRVNDGVLIRPMCPDDLPSVQIVDEAAFTRLWHKSLEGVHVAYQHAALASVAEIDGEVVGYQISSASSIGGAHLARLAVLPEAQSKGVGTALVQDLLENFRRRGVTRITVNTQADNRSSIALYEKMGFSRTGETYPIFELRGEPTEFRP